MNVFEDIFTVEMIFRYESFEKDFPIEIQWKWFYYKNELEIFLQ